MQEASLWVDQRHLADLVVDAPAQWAVLLKSSSSASATRPAARLSLACPPEEVHWRDRRVRTWFQQLLPESDLRRHLYRRQGLSLGNDVGLFLAQGADCAGAFRFLAPGRRPLRPLQRMRAVSHQQLRLLLEALAETGLPPDDACLAYLLPGSRPKMPVLVQGDSCVLPSTSQDVETTHVLKVDTQEFPDLALNEWFCMRLAESAGLRVAQVTWHDALPGALLVERVDRIKESSGRVARIHMEDFCQIRGVEPGQCYEREGGMTAGECAAVIRSYSAVPILDIKALLQWLLFSYLVGFGTGHSKHLALLHAREGVRLAPFFGIWSSHVYAAMSARVAMSIGREDRPDWLIAARWRALARDVGVRPLYVLEALRAYARSLPQLAAGILESAPGSVRESGIVNAVVELLTRRCRQALVSVVAESA